MQTLDYVSGLHNCLEFSRPSSCLNEAMYNLVPRAFSRSQAREKALGTRLGYVNTEKVLYCF